MSQNTMPVYNGHKGFHRCSILVYHADFLKLKVTYQPVTMEFLAIALQTDSTSFPWLVFIQETQEVSA